MLFIIKITLVLCHTICYNNNRGQRRNYTIVIILNDVTEGVHIIYILIINVVDFV